MRGGGSWKWGERGGNWRKKGLGRGKRREAMGKRKEDKPQQGSGGSTCSGDEATKPGPNPTLFLHHPDCDS